MKSFHLILTSFVKISVFLLFSVLYKNDLHAGEYQFHQDYYIKNFTDEDGLLQNSVEHIIKDELGNIWLTTQNGLVKYDGQKFRIYLRRDLGTSSERISELTSYPYFKGLFAVNSENQTIYISNGIPRLMRKDEPLFQRYKALFGGTESRNVFWRKGYGLSPAGTVHPVYRFDTSAYVLVIKNTFQFYRKKNLLFSFQYPIPPDQLLDYEQIRILDQYLYYTDNDKIYSIDSLGRHPVKLELDGGLESGITPKYKIFGRFENEISKYITDGKNLYEITGNDGKVIKGKLVIKNFDFDKNRIKTVLYDKSSETFFLGSLSKGFFRLTPKKFKVLKNDELESNIFYGHKEFQKGFLIAGDGYVLDFSGKVHDKNIAHGISDGWFFLQDRHGNIWTKNNNIIRVLDSSTLRVLKSYTNRGEISAMGYDAVADDVYIGSVGTREISKIRAKNFLQEDFEHVVDFHSYAIGFFRLNDEKILIKSIKGLYSYHIRDKQLKIFKGTEDMYIRHIFKSHPDDKYIWLTVEGKGLYRLEGNRMVKLPLDNNEYLSFAHAIADDHLGNFWISTNKGLFKVRKTELENYSAKNPIVFYRYYNKSYGFSTNEFNGGGDLITQHLSNGCISFASMDGIVTFHPNDFEESMPDGNITINRILNGSQLLNVGDTIEWKNRDENLYIEVSTPYFGSPEDIRFIYSIDEGQPMSSTDGRIQFNRLPIGKRTLDIYINLNSSDQKRMIKRIIIDVPRFWYETIAFQGLLAVSFFVLIFLVLKRRFTRLQSEKSHLENAVRNRTIELEETIQILSESENKLHKELYFQQSLNRNVSHNIKTPLRYLMSSMGRFHQTLMKQDNDQNKNESKKIFDATQELYNSTVQFITYMKAANKLGSPQIERLIVQKVTQESVDFYKKFIDNTSIKIFNRIDKKYSIDAPPDFFKLIISNFLDNSIKHAKANKVELESHILNDELYIIVRDNGIGIPPEYIIMFNQYFQQNSTTSLRDVYVDIGIGYFTIKEMLPYVGARIEFNGEYTQGAEISVVFKNFFTDEME